MDKVKLSPPWITYVNEVKELFADDNQVHIVYDEESFTLKFYVDDMDKADALTKILPNEKNFGNVTMKINVYPANRDSETRADLFARAFAGNPVVSYTHHAETVFGPMDYVVCDSAAAQFFNDQMDDINGLKTMLYQDIAKEVFGDEARVFFCTEADPSLAKPLGEWP